MRITKGEELYTVTEKKSVWSVSKEVGALNITVDVPKELCETEDELREYVLANDLF